MCIFDCKVGVLAADFPEFFMHTECFALGVCPLHFWVGILGITDTLHAWSINSGFYWDGFIVSSRLSCDREVVDRTVLTSQSVPQPRHGSWGRVEDTDVMLALREQPVGTSLHANCSFELLFPSVTSIHWPLQCSKKLTVCHWWPACNYFINVKYVCEKQPHKWIIMMIRQRTIYTG